MPPDAPKVSLIVPIFNVEAWLPECLDSVLNQSMEDWEAILINDGSTDRSGIIADSYAARDSRFHVVHKVNGGLGSARNAGCAVARGDYLFFLDSDDLLTRNILHDMLKAALRNSADIVVGDYHTFQEGKDQININQTYPVGQYFTDTFGKLPQPFTWQAMRSNFDLLFPGNYFCVAWGKLFRHELWTSLQCTVPDDLRLAEDFIAIKKITFSAKRVIAVPMVSYIYRKRKGSAMTKRSRKAFEIFRAYDHAVQMFNDVGVYEEESTNIHRFFMKAFIDHMCGFAPALDCWTFYKQMASIMQKWDVGKLGTSFDRVLYDKICRKDVMCLMRLVLPRYVQKDVRKFLRTLFLRKSHA